LVTNPAPVPSSNGNFENTITDFLFQDSNAVNAANANEASVQKAVRWLGNEASAAGSIRFTLNQKYLQRFGILVLYFSVGPNVQPSNSDKARFPNLEMQNQDICSWTGMRCNESGILTRIKLSKRQLYGSLPAEWGFFPNLKTIDFSNNNLKGRIPDGIYDNLVGLEELYLYKNQLTGTISSKIGNLWSLRRFHLSHNGLSGSIPAAISSTESKPRILRK
jgi:hypothetical protein